MKLTRANRDFLIPESLFEEQYNPGMAPSGDYWEFDEVVGLDPRTVWTVIDDGGATDHLYASPGFHVVNKLGYIVTEKRWDDDTLDALWHDADQPNRTLNTDQLQALSRFEMNNGRRWKSVLREAWMTGVYIGCDDTSCYLQQVRNQFGPTWLIQYRPMKPSTWSRYALPPLK